MQEVKVGKGKQKHVGGIGGNVTTFWIEAWLPLETPVKTEGEDEPRRHTRAAFKNTEITRVVEIDGKTSGFRLETGEAVPVALPFDELRARLSNPALDGDTLDLKAVTGPALDDAVEVPALQKDFSDSAEKDDGAKAQSTKNMALKFFGHDGSNGNYHPVELNTSNIKFSTLKSAANGAKTMFQVYSGTYIPGSSWVFFDIPKKEFMEMLNKAQMEGRTELDMRERTRYKRPRPRSGGGFTIG